VTARLGSIWRHPIKSHGVERLAETRLTAGACMPWDRAWAVTHEASAADGSVWAHCANFVRVAGSPEMAAIRAEFDPQRGTRMTLYHPRRPRLTFCPETEAEAFLDWVRPLTADGRAQPAGLVRATAQGMTDAAFPSVLLCNGASHVAVQDRVGAQLSEVRWRGNLWIHGPDPWTEFDWAGREIRIGTVVLRVREPAERCATINANPETGKRDLDLLSTLDGFGHRDFGMLAEVVTSGTVHSGQEVVLP